MATGSLVWKSGAKIQLFLSVSKDILSLNAEREDKMSPNCPLASESSSFIDSC